MSASSAAGWPASAPRSLLRGTARPIYEIAEEVGLANLTSFYQRFREYAGCTPQEYRTQG